jgi:hypothetical protein
MKRLLFLLLILIAGCAPRTIYVPVESIHTVTQIVRDTVIDVRLDVIHDSVTVRDTSSFLENRYSDSYASFSGGFLSHSLNTKPFNIPVHVQFINTTTTDTIQVPYVVEKVVKVNYITSWQKTRLRALNWLVFAVILWLGWKYRKPILIFIRKLIIKV